MSSFPIDWYVIDEERGWIMCQVANVMDDPGDGSDHREYNWTILHYAGDGQFSYEEDMYNPIEFGEMIKGWLEAKKAEPPKTRTCCIFGRSSVRRRRPQPGHDRHEGALHGVRDLQQPLHAAPGLRAASTTSGRSSTSGCMNEVAWTVAADKAGFKYTWATEHHFLTEYSHLSANEVFLGVRRRARPSASTSAAASSTSRRR